MALKHKGRIVWISFCCILFSIIWGSNTQNQLHADGLPSPTRFYCSNNPENPNTCYFEIAFGNDELGNPKDTKTAMEQAIDTYKNNPENVVPSEDFIILKLMIDDSDRSNRITSQDMRALAAMSSSLQAKLHKNITLFNKELNLSRFTLHSQELEKLPSQLFQEDMIFQGYEKVILPNGIKTIESNAFSGAYENESLHLVFPSTITTVAANAFTSDREIPYTIEFLGDMTSYLSDVAKMNLHRLVIHGEANPDLTTMSTQPFKDSKIKELECVNIATSPNFFDLNALYGLSVGEENNILLEKLIVKEGYAKIKAAGFANLNEVEVGGSALTEIDLQQNRLSSIEHIASADPNVKINVSGNAIDFTNTMNQAYYEANKTNANMHMLNQKPNLKIKDVTNTITVSTIEELVFSAPVYVYEDASVVDFSQPKEWIDTTYFNAYQGETKLQYYDANSLPIEKEDIITRGTYHARYMHNNQAISDLITIQYEPEESVEKIKPTVKVELVEDQDLSVSSEIKFKVSMTNPSGVAFPSDTKIKIKVDGVEVSELSYTQGEVIFQSSFQEGSHQIQGVYGGNETYDASTSELVTFEITGEGPSVTKKQVVLNLTSNASETTTSEDTITFSAQVDTEHSEDVNASATILFQVDGEEVESVTLINKKAQFTTKLTQGTHLIQAVYSGNEDYAQASSDTLSVEVKKKEAAFEKQTPNVSITVSNAKQTYTDEENITLLAQVTTTSNQDLNKEASVDFKVDGKTIISKSLQNGKAEHTMKFSTGEHQIVAEYHGNEFYHDAVSSPMDLTVSKTEKVVEDASLKALSISSGSLYPSFDAKTYRYSTTLAYTVDSITLSATPNKMGVSLHGDIGKVSLKVGLNELNVLVKDGDSEATYVIAITREAQSSSLKQELKNKDGSISIFGDFDDTYELKTQPKEAPTLLETDSKNYELLNTFDIYLMKNGEKVALNQSVEVRINVNSDWSKTASGVMYIGENGEIELMPSTVNESYISFTTNHFSIYAVYAKNTVSIEESIQTGTNDSIGYYLCATFIGVFMLVGICKKQTQSK